MYQKTIREYWEQLYANKLDNLEDMDKCLQTYSPSKLNLEELDHFNRLITRNETFEEWSAQDKKVFIIHNAQSFLLELKA